MSYIVEIDLGLIRYPACVFGSDHATHKHLNPSTPTTTRITPIGQPILISMVRSEVSVLRSTCIKVINRGLPKWISRYYGLQYGLLAVYSNQKVLGFFVSYYLDSSVIYIDLCCGVYTIYKGYL